ERAALAARRGSRGRRGRARRRALAHRRHQAAGRAETAQRCYEKRMTSAQGTKLDKLRQVVRGYRSALVAFSGGADSALVLKVAADELGAYARAMTAVSPTMARREKARAMSFAAELGVAIDVVDSHELERPGFKMNPTDRC